MIGPQLQTAIFAALTSAPALCDGRAYDNPPAEAKRIATTGAAWPLIEIGNIQILDDGNSCGDGWEAYVDLHVWSRPEARSKLEASTVMAAIVDRLVALDGVAGFTVTVAALDTARTLNDPDGITEHGVVTMRFLLDPV